MSFTLDNIQLKNIKNNRTASDGNNSMNVHQIASFKLKKIGN